MKPRTLLILLTLTLIIPTASAQLLQPNPTGNNCKVASCHFEISPPLNQGQYYAGQRIEVCILDPTIPNGKENLTFGSSNKTTTFPSLARSENCADFKITDEFVGSANLHYFNATSLVRLNFHVAPSSKNPNPAPFTIGFFTLNTLGAMGIWATMVLFFWWVGFDFSAFLATLGVFYQILIARGAGANGFDTTWLFLALTLAAWAEYLLWASGRGPVRTWLRRST